jgi:hypothetical protein
MKKIDLGQSVAILANVGVIASIVLLSLELRQNNELMSVQARATVVSLQTEVWRPTLEQPDVAPMLLKDRRGEALSDEEELRLSALWVRTLFNIEFAFQETPEQRPQLIAVWRRAFAAYGSLRRTWNGVDAGAASASKNMFSPEFIEFIDSNVIGP